MALNKRRWAGIACGVCCALCVALYLASVRGEVDAARAEALERYGGEQIEVCVAKRDLAAGEVVDSSAVAQRLWVADLLPDGAVSDPSQIIGQRLGSNIIRGEVICAQRAERGDSSLSVPMGKAAISVPARAVQAVGGSVEAGMEVDVYATGASSTTKLVSSALVLASSAAAEGATASTGEWVTLAIDPDRVQEMVAAAQNLELYFVLPAVGGSAESGHASTAAVGDDRSATAEDDDISAAVEGGDASAAAVGADAPALAGETTGEDAPSPSAVNAQAEEVPHE